MKKYKHKQTGKIAERVEDVTIFYKVQFPDNNCFPIWVVENSCDWEEIKEKIYEILAYKHKINGIIYTKGTGECFYTKGSTIPYSAKGYYTELYDIYSVKRLNDGEIFTIGDNVEYQLYTGDWSDNKGVITGFRIDGTALMIATKHSNCWARLSNTIRKIEKKVLFTTEDRIDVVDENQKLCMVHSNFDITTEILAKYVKSLLLSYGGKVFYDREKAEEYALWNKKQYSLKDIEDCKKPFGNYYGNFNVCTDEIISILKSRK
jgi:hypothetical protein